MQKTEIEKVGEKKKPSARGCSACEKQMERRFTWQVETISVLRMDLGSVFMCAVLLSLFELQVSRGL